jgi:hypothetical protein
MKLLVTAALCAAVFVAAGCQSRSHLESDLVLRDCGQVAAGKSWRVQATRSVDCGSGREIVRSFLAPSCLPARSHAGMPCTVTGYRCVELALSGGAAQVRCTSSARMVLARANR